MKRVDLLNFGCLENGFAGAGPFVQRAMLLVLLSGLAACISREAAWYRPSTPDPVRARDYADCRAEAQSLAGSQLGVDQDIAASRGSDWERTGQYDARVEANSASDAAAFSSALSTCMSDKGYRQR